MGLDMGAINAAWLCLVILIGAVDWLSGAEQEALKKE
jgi:hypothetical protein